MVEEQVIKLGASEGRVDEGDEEKCEELNAKFKSAFTVDTINPVPVRWDGEEDLEIIEIVRKVLSRLLKGLDPQKAHVLDESYPYVLKECAGILDRLLEM